jgi:hypothetical protein
MRFSTCSTGSACKLRTFRLCFFIMLASLSPIVGKAVKAIVRRKLGTMYGFEFLGLTESQKHQLRGLAPGHSAG